jgi:hypothetical protein
VLSGFLQKHFFKARPGRIVLLALIVLMGFHIWVTSSRLCRLCHFDMANRKSVAWESPRKSLKTGPNGAASIHVGWVHGADMVLGYSVTAPVAMCS